jgi:hypothetical protein
METPAWKSPLKDITDEDITATQTAYTAAGLPLQVWSQLQPAFINNLVRRHTRGEPRLFYFITTTPSVQDAEATPLKVPEELFRDYIAVRDHPFVHYCLTQGENWWQAETGFYMDTPFRILQGVIYDAVRKGKPLQLLKHIAPREKGKTGRPTLIQSAAMKEEREAYAKEYRHWLELCKVHKEHIRKLEVDYKEKFDQMEEARKALRLARAEGVPPMPRKPV